MERRFSFRVSGLNSLISSQFSSHDFSVYYPASLKQPRNNSVIFSKNGSADVVEKLSQLRECIIIVPLNGIEMFNQCANENVVVPVENPRLEFARLLTAILSKERKTRAYCTLDNGAIIGENVVLGEDVVIEPLAFIDHDVIIGHRSIISTGAKIRRFTSIGDDSVIRESAVVGGPGFGFERSADGTPIRLPHLGGVQIGSRVEIGALTTVVGGTIDPTIVEDDVKIDDHVHVAHNCIIRRGALITACAEVSGSVEIGEYAWLGPNCSVLQSLSVGPNSVVGLGAVVIRAVPPEATVAGNPAEPTPNIKAFNVAKSRLLRAVEEGRL